MQHPKITRRLVVALTAVTALGSLAAVPGCYTKKPEKHVKRYQRLPDRPVPAFLKSSVMEYAEIQNLEAFPVSGYGLVANLNNTGDCVAPTAVREYMAKEMQKHRFGSETMRGFSDATPSRIMRDPRFAIVRVDGNLPPGIRKGQHFDVSVSALSESNTASLARGNLYQTDLRIDGANPISPGGSVNSFARTQGAVFVNPAYAFTSNPTDSEARRSLRRGTLMDGGVSMTDRPIMLRVRNPQFSITRRLERAIDDRMQDVADIPKKGAASASFGVSEAQDEAFVYCWVPINYERDWEHFAGIVSHVYIDSSPDFVARKAREVAEAAVLPNAPFSDITYAWEALGKIALPTIQPLMTHPDPNVAFAATRAAAFLGDGTAPQVLGQIAKQSGNPYRVKAVETLGAIPNSQLINELLRPLLDAEETSVRLAAYDALARNHDSTIFTKVVGPSMVVTARAESGNGKREKEVRDEKFVLDIVRSSGKPIVYCSQRGIPRIAIIGDRTSLSTPLVFSTMDNHLTISSDNDDKSVLIFYRPQMPAGAVDAARSREEMEHIKERMQPIRIPSRPDLAEIVARLAGEGGDLRFGNPGLNFNYAEVVSILTAMSEAQQLSAASATGARVPTALVLQETGNFRDTVFSAPTIPGTEGRPQTDAERKQVGMAN